MRRFFRTLFKFIVYFLRISADLFYTAESLHPRMCVCMSAFKCQILFFIGMNFACKFQNNNGFIYTIFLYFVNYIFYIFWWQKNIKFQKQQLEILFENLVGIRLKPTVEISRTERYVGCYFSPSYSTMYFLFETQNSLTQSKYFCP